MRRSLVAVATALMLLLAASAPARAFGPPVPAGPRALVPLFAPWGDPHAWWVIPGGRFETGLADWQLVGPAALVGNSRLDGLGHRVGAGALRLGPGARAVSRTLVLVEGESSVRLFARRLAGTAPLRLHVAVTVPATGRSAAVDVALRPGLAWAPVPTTAFPALFGPDGTEQVELELRATGDAAVVVDDVAIDPFKSR